MKVCIRDTKAIKLPYRRSWEVDSFRAVDKAVPETVEELPDAVETL